MLLFVERQVHDHLTCTAMLGGTKQCTAHQTRQKKYSVTLRASAFVKSSLVRSYHHQLIRLSEYRMREWTTAVDQPPFPPVFNTADNALDGFDVSGVQGPSL
jgi:hypothetical protein